LTGALSGHPRPILPLPGPLATVQALVLECLPGEPMMSRDNLASMRVPNIATGQLPGLEALGIQAASLAAIAPRYLAPGQAEGRLDTLRAKR
ncbi:MAG: complex I NDUFA9 subunit family protein, partial [Burkholderiales bacterium]